MYLSKVTLKQSPELFEFLTKRSGTDGYIAHSLLWKLFPNDGSKKRDFLFYKDETGEFPFFLLFSKDKPMENDVFGVCVKNFAPEFMVGDRLAFTLVANPVISRRKEGKSFRCNVLIDARCRRKAEGGSPAEINAEGELVAKKWLIAQGEKNGFSCLPEMIRVDGCRNNYFYKKKKDSPIRFSSVHYEGVLNITEPDKFMKMMEKGLGKARAFGCGLMLVRRI